jgi:hypothetical protein
MYFFKTIFWSTQLLVAVALCSMWYFEMIDSVAFIILIALFSFFRFACLNYGKFIPMRLEHGQTYRLVGHSDDVLFLTKETDVDLLVPISVSTSTVIPSAVEKMHLHFKNKTIYYGKILNGHKHDLHIGDLCIGVRGKNKSEDGVVKK